MRNIFRRNRRSVESTGTHQMRVLGRSGDTKIEWNVLVDEEVKSAAEQFNDLVAQQFTAFRIAGDDANRTSEQIDVFDPEAATIIMVPRISGG